MAPAPTHNQKKNDQGYNLLPSRQDDLSSLAAVATSAAGSNQWDTSSGLSNPLRAAASAMGLYSYNQAGDRLQPKSLSTLGTTQQGYQTSTESTMFSPVSAAANDDAMDIDNPPSMVTKSPNDFSILPASSSEQQSIMMSHFLATATQPTHKANPLEIPEILTHILSYLESPLTTSTDPTKPLDFVKIDSIKYTVNKPKLHACALVSKFWNACATKFLWKNLRIGRQHSVERLARTLGSKTKGGQISRMAPQDFALSEKKNACWGTCPEKCKFHEGFVLLPSLVNGWVYGELIRSFTIIQPHGPGAEAFEKWNLDFLVSLVAISCPNLEELNLSNCAQVTDKSMTLIARHCQKLRKLNLNRCDMISSTTIHELAVGCKDLVIFNLSRPLIHPRMIISDDSLLALVKTNPNLMELRIRNCDAVSDRTIIEMTRVSGKSIRALDMSWCTGITDRALVEGVARNCPNLTSLALNGCKRLTDRSLHALLTHCPSIMSLSLAHLPFISDRVLTAMAERLRNLVILSLNGCVEVKDASVVALSRQCRQLQSLSLFSLGITDRAVQSVSQNCPNLISLSISGCTLVTDAGAKTIASLRKLQSLYLNGSAITDDSIVQIAQVCRLIRALSLNDCRRLSDRAAVALASHCTSIQSLSMNSCGVSSVGVKCLADRCADLRELSIKDCPNCILDGPAAKKMVCGNGGMNQLTAIGEETLMKLKRRRVALMR